MIKKIKQVSLIVLLFSGTFAAKGQDYNYQVLYSSQQYSSLEDDTTRVITTIPQLEDVNELPVGFSFTFAGRTVDSISLRSNGLITFDPDFKYNFIFLNKAFVSETEDTTYSSSLSYSVSTDTNDQKILAIQFKNVMLMRGDDKIYFNFQVWLYQYNNAIEFHMGDTHGTMPSENYLMGLINEDDTDVNPVGYLLEGDPASSTGVGIPAQGDLVELTALPALGTVYKFTPSN